MAEDTLVTQVINEQFIIGRRLGEGSYGTLRLGKNRRTKEHVAIKFEKLNHPTPTLPLEYMFYKSVEGAPNFPKIHFFGRHKEYNVLVMEVLGSSLEHLFDEQKRVFSEKTIINIMIQLIEMMRALHRKNIIYRDVKPENFLIGKTTDKENTIYVVDFGLAKYYIEDNGKHIKYREDKGVIGTARYMSINAHDGKELSRRDDLEAIGYVGLYFLNEGMLPWQGLKIPANTDPGLRYRMIGETKKANLRSNNNALQKLCKHNDYFVRYMMMVKSLAFTEEPRYDSLKDLFQKVKDKKLYDNNMDWTGKLVNKGVDRTETASNVRVGQKTRVIPNNN